MYAKLFLAQFFFCYEKKTPFKKLQECTHPIGIMLSKIWISALIAGEVKLWKQLRPLDISLPVISDWTTVSWILLIDPLQRAKHKISPKTDLIRGQLINLIDHLAGSQQG